MSYTDKQLLRASKIAYYSIDSTVIRDVDRAHGANSTPTYTLLDLFENSATFRRSIYRDLRIAEGLTEEEKNALDDVPDNEVVRYLDLSNKQTVLGGLNDNKIAYQRVEDIFNLIEEITSDTGLLHDWKVTSFCYNNEMTEAGTAGILKNGVWEINDSYTEKGNGFVSVTFETDENNAIVAFRGSDSLSNDEYVLTDWIAADGALILDGENTVQQDFASQYMADYISQLGYDNLAMTGHSLGGNLAMHSAVDKLSKYSVFSDKPAYKVTSEEPSAYHVARENILVNTLKAQELLAA